MVSLNEHIKCSLFIIFFFKIFQCTLFKKKSFKINFFFFFLYFPFGKWILSITKIKSMHENFFIVNFFFFFQNFFLSFWIFINYSLNIFLQMWISCERKWYNHGLKVCKKEENLALEFMEVDHSKLTAVGFSHYIPSLGLDNLTI